MHLGFRLGLFLCAGGLSLLLGGGEALGQVQRVAKAAPANVATPELTGIFPPGASVGQTTEWVISGRNLDKIERWIVSGKGVEIGESKTEGNAIRVPVKVAADAEPGYREVRAAGMAGVSNLMIVRVDTLKQSVESEPNDTLDKASPLAVGAAAAGVLKPQDVDCYKLTARAGERVTIELEAQRLGVGITPLVTVLAANGAALAQGHEHPGVDHDCRIAFTFPADGEYLIQVRDNTFLGADTAGYRLRIDRAPFATGMFPLGGLRGKEVSVTASGGSLTSPRTKTVKLPDSPGELFDPGLFDGPEGPALAPGRMQTSNGPEINESTDGQPTALALGTTANGRLERSGEVDRYTIEGKKGQSLHFGIQAAPLGSWLDSVLTLRDEKGNMLAENDDPGNPNQRRGAIALGLPETPPDSRLEYTPKADGPLTLEVADRYGDGGPEYGYRLEASASRGDFSLALLLTNPNANRFPAGARNVPAVPGSGGCFNLKPGSTQPVNFLITPEGFNGSIEVKAEGLPEGVTAAPVTVRVSGNSARPQPVGGSIVLKTAPDAQTAIGELRVVGVGKPNDGKALPPPDLLFSQITRTATATVAFSPLPTQNPSPFGVRAISRSIASLPVAVTAGARRPVAKPDFVGPLKPIVVTLKKAQAPGPLLAGGRIELDLQFDPLPPAYGSFQLDADVDGKGILVQTVLADAETASAEAGEPPAVVRVLASVDAKPGRQNVKLAFKSKFGEKMTVDVPVEVKLPIKVDVQAPEKLILDPGGSATFKVTVMREPGFGGPVEIAFDKLPKGASAGGPMRLARDKNELEVRVSLPSDAEPITKMTALQVVGLARMPRGPVRVDSAKQPMVMSRSAEK